MSRAFPAQHAGRCTRDDCPAPAFRENESIRYGENDQIEHEACPEPPPPPEVCPIHFEALSLTGACGQCD